MDLKSMSKKDLGKHFELSVVEDILEETMRQLCSRSKEYNLRTVFTAPMWIPVMMEELADSDVMPGSGISFPYGAETPKVKAYAIEEIIKMGAVSVDFIMNVAALKAGKRDIVEEEFKLFGEVAKDVEKKVIIEVCRLNDEEIRTACKMIVQAGFQYVKSSTGQFQGPSMEQVAIMLDEIKGTDVKGKVAGVKFPHAQNAFAYLSAGIDLIGSQNVFKMLDGFELLRDLSVVR